MDNLIAFVTARIDEDEAAAKAATERQPLAEWEAAGQRGEDDKALSNWIVTGIANPGLPFAKAPAGRSIMRHIARHDPARVLREVAAKRAILAVHHAPSTETASHYVYEEAAAYCTFCGPGDDWTVKVDTYPAALWPCFHARQLAAVWSDHPDYRAEWAVSGQPA